MAKGKTNKITNPSDEVENEKKATTPKFFLFRGSSQAVFLRDVKRFGRDVLTNEYSPILNHTIHITHFDNEVTVVVYKDEKIRDVEFLSFIEWLEENGVEFTNKTV